MNMQQTVEKLLADSKGILAADESFNTIGKRFAKNNIESTADTRCQYREMLFSTPGIEQFISGIILFDETIYQTASSGKKLIDLIKEKGIVPGIKVDTGTHPIPNFPEEKITSGLDELENRLKKYRDAGARFAKWRAVFSIGPKQPSSLCIDANAEVLARYATMCQNQDIVPIVEPEVLMEGDHTIHDCEEATTIVLERVFSHLFRHRANFELLLLKPNMVLPGKNAPNKVNPTEVAQATVRTLRRSVPAAVPGIAFLSGGQTPVEATQHLAAINQLNPQPWVLTFSFSRALQDNTLQIWGGKKQNVSEAQKSFIYRAQSNSAARRGQFINQ